MGQFNRDNRFGGRRDFNRRDFGNRPSGSGNASFQAICSRCGKTCELPFKPNGKKPVFCNDCFKNNRGFENKQDDRNFDRPRFNRPDFANRNEFKNKNVDQNNYKEQFVALNKKLDTILKLLTPAIPEKVAPVIDTPVVAEEQVVVAKPKKKAAKKAVATKETPVVE